MRGCLAAAATLVLGLGQLCLAARPASPPTPALAESGSRVDVNYRWVYSNPEAAGTAEAAGAAPLLYSHMGMLQVLPNGTLAAAWQAAPVWYEGAASQELVWAVSEDRGLTWGPHRTLVAPAFDLPVWAPVLHVQGNETFLFYSVSRAPCWTKGEGGQMWSPGGDIYMQTSSDSGATWAKPQMVLAYDDEGGIAKMIANKLARARDGSWVLPFWREMGGPAACRQRPELHGEAGVLLTRDQGHSWGMANVSRSNDSAATWLIEAAVAPAGDGGERLLQVFRTSVGVLYSSASTDGAGRQWAPAAPMRLPNPNSKVDLAALPDGTLLLALNDNATARSPLALAASRDGGATWRRVAVLEDDPDGNFHYPTVIFMPGRGGARDQVAVIYSVDLLPGHQYKDHTGSLVEALAPAAAPLAPSAAAAALAPVAAAHPVPSLATSPAHPAAVSARAAAAAPRAAAPAAHPAAPPAARPAAPPARPPALIAHGAVFRADQSLGGRRRLLARAPAPAPDLAAGPDLAAAAPGPAAAPPGAGPRRTRSSQAVVVPGKSVKATIQEEKAVGKAQVEAWGKVSWGMRIAVLDAASVMEAARSVALGDVLA